MPSNDMIPSTSSRGPLLPSFHRKRQHMIDDDNTFVPPALSAYSIALLSEKSPNKHPKLSESPTNPVTGIYELDFPDSRSNLKDKLSVHFKDISPNNSVTPEDKDRKGSSAPNNSYASLNEGANSLHNSFNMSNFTNTHNTSEPDDISLDGNPRSQSNTTSTTPGTTALKTASQQLSIKRSRLARRFKSLGPPKRASQIPQEEITPSETQSKNTSPLKAESFNPIIADKSESKFYKALEKLKAETPDNLFSIEKEIEIRKRIEDQKRLNQLEHSFARVQPMQSIDLELDRLSKSKERLFPVYSENPSRNSSTENKENVLQENMLHNDHRSRDPLVDIPVNTFTAEDKFLKPKFSKSVPNLVTPVAPQPQHERIQAPPSASVQSAPISEPNPSHEESKKKKAMAINGTYYEKLELLGRGGTSKVYKVKCLTNNRLYAIKKVAFDQFDDTCIQGFKGEIDLLLKLGNSERVVKLVDHAIGENTVCLVMECGDIDLAHVLQNKLNSSTLDVNFIRFHAIEMFKCVQAVHGADIVHSDLKPANFLFVKGILKIIDFGIANAVPDHTANVYRESQIGTLNYMAPEALTEVNQGLHVAGSSGQTWKVGKPSDVWSCGCIIYQMIYGKPPYAAYSSQQKIMAILNPQIKVQYSNKGIGGVKVPLSAIELMQKCLERDPNDRWTIAECLDSDFLSPKIVSETFVKDLVHLAVNFGYNNHMNGGSHITDEVYEKLVDTVLKQIEDLHYA